MNQVDWKRISFVVKCVSCPSPMKCPFIIIASFCLILSAAAGLNKLHGQMIVNGGFESLVSLPTTTGQWFLASGWTSTGSSENDPDVYHVQGNGGGDLPETPVAIVSPYQGMAIAGFMASGTPGTNRREYITGTFSSPLNPGATYRMTFRMTNGELTPFSNGGLGIGGLGMHFSMGPLQQIASSPITVEPNFELTPVFFSRNWETISFSFVADAAWTHFTWGAFGYDGEHTITVEEGNAPTMAYCFVDDFSVVLDDGAITHDEITDKGPTVKPSVEMVNLETEPSWFVPNAFTPNGDGENDSFRPVWNNMSLERFEVFSRWGELVYSMDEGEAGWNGKTQKGKEAEPGMYIWQMELIEDSGKKVSESGAIVLIR